MLWCAQRFISPEFKDLLCARSIKIEIVGTEEESLSRLARLGLLNEKLLNSCCVSQGRTIEEALESIKDAIQGCLDVLGERVSVQQSERIVEVEA